MHRSIICLVILSLFFFPSKIQANNNQFITIVNPVRISNYNHSPAESLKNQYGMVAKNNLAASWLLTYDAITYPEIKEVIKTMDINQDIGIFMEVSENFTNNFGVKYNKSDSWHRSNSLFLAGYSQDDRIKLIDGIFEEFKTQLGAYPTSVGGWWTDSFSLYYMQKKYGITANLVVSDQLGTDGYTIWGQYWSAPYYPSKHHAAIPAPNLENKLAVVNLQWAPRDPLNGYKSPALHRNSLYSTQDYYTISLPDKYFEDLIDLYAAAGKNEFGQITYGLEGDFNADSYTPDSQYAKYINSAKKFSDTGQFAVANMKQFSNWYQSRFPKLSPEYIVESEDLTGKTENQVIWYQNSNYRAGMVFDKKNKKFRFIDLRAYQKNYQEPFYLSKNGQLDLNINLPSVIDTVLDPQRYLELVNIKDLSSSKEAGKFNIKLNDNILIEFVENKITFNNINQQLPDFIAKSDLVSVIPGKNNISLIIANDFPVDQSGYKFTDLTIEATYFFKTKKAKLLIFVMIILFVLGTYKLSRVGKGKKILLVATAILLSAGSFFWYFKNSQYYYVSQSEVDALLKLKTYPKAKVLVLNHDCLSCSAETAYRPAVFANKRNYVKKFSNKNLILDNELIEIYSNVLTIPTTLKREEAKDYLNKTGADFIYLVRHQDYIEKLPYSPGDLGVEQIYFNSDAEIWRVKK